MGSYHQLQSDVRAKELQVSRCVGWGAAIIDERGNEVPITEQMIQQACEDLARSWTFPRATTQATC